MRTYEQDFAGWAEDTAKAIEEGRWQDIDRESLADEVLGLSKSNKRQLESALRVLLLHLLKAEYQPDRATRSWELSIRIQRRGIMRFLKESPSLGPQIATLVTDAYEDARLEAANETQLGEDTFPQVCPWNFQEIIGE